MSDCPICHGSTWVLDDEGEARACECRVQFSTREFRQAQRLDSLRAERPELDEAPPVFEGPQDPGEILGEVFGYETFRGLQGEVVEHILAGDDALVVMPTGGGKSLCFQIPAIARQRQGMGITIVVSPLVALMRDQVKALKRVGVPAEALNSAAAGRRARARMLRGTTTVVYVSPERATSQIFLEDLTTLAASGRVALLAVDEAHCVAHWGRDFRPSYLALGELRTAAPDVPCVALTASADERTRTEVLRTLRMGNARQFVTDFDRPNIRYTVEDKSDVAAQLPEFVRTRHWNECGIVYCRKRQGVEQLVGHLRSQGIRALPFHAGLSGREKRRAHEIFMRDDAVVIVSTVAFGMGIDRPDVRFVAHVDLPPSIEAYYQETGRAGRDGAPAEAWLLFSRSEADRVRSAMAADERSDEESESLRRFDALIATVTSAGCRRQRLLEHFGQTIEPCGNCDACGADSRSGTELSTAPHMPTEISSDLVSELRALRSNLSAEHGVPAFSVYSDRTIAAIARRRPRDLDELASVKGFGPMRIKAYGEHVLGVLTSRS